MLGRVSAVILLVSACSGTATEPEKLNVLKTPDYAKRAFPDTADYMIFLERFPAYAERGWHGTDAEGYFGSGGNNENAIRSLTNFVFVYSLLVSEERYDASVSCVPRDKLLSHARAAIRYLCRGHVTGEGTCANGKKWGDHWQSAWWTSKLSAGVYLIWDKLSLEEQSAFKRVLDHEADRHLDRRVPSQEFENTRSEENAWDSEVLAWAACLLPDYEHASLWLAKAREFFMNTLSVAQDAADNTVVDGKPVKEWVYTRNVHSDFTIENHGGYHFCYMACPLHSLSWAYYAFRSTGHEVPQSLFHHFLDVWQVIRRTHLYDGRFAYLSGKDWARYLYGLYFIMPPLAVLQNEFGDRDARLIEMLRFKTFEWEQRYHSDGSAFSGRFSNNIMEGWPHEYETDCFANLGLVYLLHKGREPLEPTPMSEFQKKVAGTFRSEDSQFMFARTDKAFISFSWRLLKPHGVMGLFVPGDDHIVEWGENNLVGSFLVKDADMRVQEKRHNDLLVENGFTTTGVIQDGKLRDRFALKRFVSFTGLPEHALAVIIQRCVAEEDVTITRDEGLQFYLPNDIFNANLREIFSENGALKLTGVGGEAQEIPIETRWINVDNKLGIGAVDNRLPFTVQDNPVRNAPWKSLLYEVIDCPLRTEPRIAKRGDVVRDDCFVLVAADAERTRTLAKACEFLRAPRDDTRVATILLDDTTCLVVAANFADTEQHMTVQLPSRETTQMVVPPLTTTVTVARQK